MSPPETVYIPTPHGRIEAWVYLPSPPPSTPPPVIILGCGLGSIKPSVAIFAQTLRDAGYATIAFDYLTWGGSEGTPRHAVIVWNQYRDFQAVIAWARLQDTGFKFDSSRLVVWGSSFAGLHVTRLLIEDSSIVAGIAQCPCVDAAEASRMKPLYQSARLMFWAAVDFVGSCVGADPVYLQISVTPDRKGGPALMDAPDVARDYERVHEGQEGVERAKNPFDNKVLARSLLSFPVSRPARGAHRIIAPYLVVLSSEDSVAPRGAAERMARVASRGELLEVPGGHFDLYQGESLQVNLRGQLEFLRRVVPIE